MKKNEILAEIKEAFLNVELSTQDLSEISNFCMEMALSYDPQGELFLKLYDKIPIPEGERRIGLFNAVFKKYSKRFIIFPEMIDFMVKQNRPADIYFIQRNRKTDVVYVLEKEGMKEIFHLDCVRKDISVKDYYTRKSDFESTGTGIKSVLDTKNNPNKHGCPTKVKIPLEDLLAFDKEKYSYADLTMSINDVGNQDTVNRVGLVMRYYDLNGKLAIESYDTFDPCPPGTCN